MQGETEIFSSSRSFIQRLEQGKSWCEMPYETPEKVLNNYANLIFSGLAQVPRRAQMKEMLRRHASKCSSCGSALGEISPSCAACVDLLDTFKKKTAKILKTQFNVKFSCSSPLIPERNRAKKNNIELDTLLGQV